MIKVKKHNLPVILELNQHSWTSALLNLVKSYGGYEKIPEAEKISAVNKYRNEEIKKAVINITKGKCIFCEAFVEVVDYSNIEHFYPKSIYPKFTFKWSNLFPACRKCNIPKGDVDTRVEYQFVHPVGDNVEDYFIYDNLKIAVSPTAPDLIKATNTIKFCELERISLCREHSEILFEFYNIEDK